LAHDLKARGWEELTVRELLDAIGDDPRIELCGNYVPDECEDQDCAKCSLWKQKEPCQ